MGYVGLCERCGFFKRRTDSQLVCPVCSKSLRDTRLTTKDFCEMTKEDKEQFVENFMTMEGITLDPYWVNKKEEYLKEEDERAKEQAKKFQKNFEQYDRTHAVCPYCHKNNTKKISTGSRLLSVGLWGLASSKVGKQWHCNNCNSDF